MTAQPYYTDDLVSLYHADCREETAWLAADVLVTDPPYGRNWAPQPLDRRYKEDRKALAGDTTTALRDHALAMWGPDRLAIVFGDLMLAPPTGTKLVALYLKPQDAGVAGAIGGLRRDVEAVYLIGPWPHRIGGRSSLFRTAAPITAGAWGLSARAGHPHAKPQDLMAELLAMCPPGVIADPFAGSGSTLVAAKLAGRPAIGVEVDQRYADTAAHRLRQDPLPITTTTTVKTGRPPRPSRWNRPPPVAEPMWDLAP